MATNEAKPWLAAIALGALFAACAIGPPREWPTDAPMRVRDGFVVELVYSVPRTQQGSWVSLAIEPDGALLASDQTGRVYRVLPGPPGSPASETRVAPHELNDLGHAHGILYAFDSLYVMRNEDVYLGPHDNGLYRARDEDGDGALDPPRLLRALDGTSEHGPHQAVVAPTGDALFVLAGNATAPTAFSSSRSAERAAEDVLLPVIPNRWILNTPPPGGWIARIDPEGERWESFAAGFRNPYDLAFHESGDLFVFDADMEWDIGAPWYRPTRLLHVRSGGEYGWRRGSAKWPASHADSLGSVADVGTGSPTGVAFGYGTAFPTRYRDALYLLDWSHGKIYAAHLQPSGSTWQAKIETFVTGQPLPVTDIAVRPQDGALYFTTGGRGAASALYRVRYIGEGLVDRRPAEFASSAPNELHALRRDLEALHGAGASDALVTAWPVLHHSDRGIRYAARVALEHVPAAEWRERALTAEPADARIQSLLALARVGEAADQAAAIDALLALEPSTLSQRQRLDRLRAISLWLARHEMPEDPASLVAALNREYPAATFAENRALSELLTSLRAESAIPKTLALLDSATTQEEQLHYALALSAVVNGWEPEQRRDYFAWLARARAFTGGDALQYFVEQIDSAARGHLTFADRIALGLAEDEVQPPLRPVRAAGPGRVWTLDQAHDLLAEPLEGRDFARGERMFAAGACFTCHRFAGRGGAEGPDLTAVGGRFTSLEIAASILEPSQTVSDQYRAVDVVLQSGEHVRGRVTNFYGNLLGIDLEAIEINTDMQSNVTRRIPPDEIASITPSEVSMMPRGLVDAMNPEELRDLIAYLLSGGDPGHTAFR